MAPSTTAEHIDFLLRVHQLNSDLIRDLLPGACQQLFFVSFELRPRCAHQVMRASCPQPSQIGFTDDASVKNPHPSRRSVFLFHRFDHLLQGGDIGPVTRKNFVTQRKAFWGDDEPDDQLFAVWAMIARITALSQSHPFHRCFKIGAGQVIEQQIVMGTEKVPPLGCQVLFQALFVRQQPIQTTVESVLVRHARVGVQQQFHGRLPKPFLMHE